MTSWAKVRMTLLRLERSGRWPPTLGALAAKLGVEKMPLSLYMSRLRKAGLITHVCGGKGTAGRPPLERPKRQRFVYIKVTDAEHAKLLAHIGDGTLSAFVRLRIADVIR